MASTDETALEILSRVAEHPSEIRRMEGNPLTLAYFAKVLLAKGKTEGAIELARRALMLAPGNGEVEAVASRVLSNDVPSWHFSIVRDCSRNTAYEEALHRHAQGKRVLEIGAGSGILAMMAARAGAKEVISCEYNPALAAVAREIASLNGYSNRIKIVAKHSRDLKIGEDLDQPFDVLVSEIVSSDLLGQDVLGCMENAIGRLTHSNACIIPSHGSLRIALANYRRLDEKRLGTKHGFDLSPLNQVAPRIEMKVDDESLELRSEPQNLFAFDFSSGGPFESYQSSSRLISTGGDVNGIAQWIQLRMDFDGSYEN